MSEAVMAVEQKNTRCHWSSEKCAQLKNGGRRFSRGYDTSHLPEKVCNQLDEFKKPHTKAAVLEGILTALSILFIAFLLLLSVVLLQAVSDSSWVVWVGAGAFYLVALVAIARQQRGLEILVHDASHQTWHPSERMNNFLADLFVASPVLSSIAAYWKSHRTHHGRFGSHSDPCLARFERMGLGQIDLSTRWKLTKAVLRWIIPYSVEYYKEIGGANIALIGRFLTWHTCAYIAPTALFIGYFGRMNVFPALVYSFVAWFLFWIIPWVIVLPVVRSIAESEEHDYNRADTEFDATFSNLGLMHRMIFHPKKDGYHVIHHMFPTIPERMHDKVHALLMEHDYKYRNSAIRTRVMEDKTRSN